MVKPAVWRRRPIRSGSKLTMWAAWGFAIFWNLISMPLPFLLLDEITSAPPSVSAAAYQLILDRRLGEYQVPVCKAHDALCSPEGIEMIEQDVAANQLNRVVVALAGALAPLPLELHRRHLEAPGVMMRIGRPSPSM